MEVEDEDEEDEEDEEGRFVSAGILRSGGVCLAERAGEEAGELETDMGLEEEGEGVGLIFAGAGTKDDDDEGEGEEEEEEADDEEELFLEFFSRLPSPKRAK